MKICKGLKTNKEKEKSEKAEKKEKEKAEKAEKKEKEKAEKADRKSVKEKAEKKDKKIIEDFNIGFYYCPACKQIPKIIYDSQKMTVEILCKKCNSEKQEMTLESFLSEIEKKKPKSGCYKKHKIHSNKTISYCTHCLKWFCQHCLDAHKTENADHFVIESDGMIMSSICEKEACEKKEAVTSYCEDCGLHICDNCALSHDESHSIVNIKNDLDNFYIFKECNSIIEKSSTQFNNFYINAIEAIEDLERQLATAKERVNKMKQNSNSIFSFFKTLILAYNKTKNVLNYNVRVNLKENLISDIFSSSIIAFKKEVSESFVNSKLVNFVSNLDPNNLDNIPKKEFDDFQIISKKEVMEPNSSEPKNEVSENINTKEEDKNVNEEKEEDINSNAKNDENLSKEENEEEEDDEDVNIDEELKNYENQEEEDLDLKDLEEAGKEEEINNQENDIKEEQKAEENNPVGQLKIDDEMQKNENDIIVNKQNQPNNEGRLTCLFDEDGFYIGD